MTAPYNSLNGIATYLTDLEGLNRLAADRRLAKKNGETLNDFCVLGRWSFDEFGQVSPLGGKGYKAPAELGNCPSVMTTGQLELFMRDDALVRISDWPFPPEYATCTVCGEKWTLANAQDFVHNQESEEVVIEQYVEQLLSHITQIPDMFRVKKHFVTYDIVYNDHHPEGAKTRKAQNGNLWRDVDKDYIVQPGDRASVRVMSFTHRACYQAAGERRARTEFEEAFKLAGYPKVNLVTQKNRYCDCVHCTPWYSAQVAGSPPFTVGWRKSVINLSWEESGISLPDLFEGEPVSHDAFYIHAHGYQKLTQYLAKLLPALGAVRDA